MRLIRFCGGLVALCFLGLMARSANADVTSNGEVVPLVNSTGNAVVMVPLQVGVTKTGSVRVNGGKSLGVARDVTFGVQNGSAGRGRVSGVNSTLETDAKLIVGLAGTGRLDLRGRRPGQRGR